MFVEDLLEQGPSFPLEEIGDGTLPLADCHPLITVQTSNGWSQPVKTKEPKHIVKIDLSNFQF